MLDCKLCSKWSYTKYICDDCKKIKNMINLYSLKTVIDVLECVLVRDSIKRNYKIKEIKKEGLTDNSNDRDYKKEKEIKTVDIKELNNRCLKQLKTKLDKLDKV